MIINKKVIQIMQDIKINHHELSTHGGFGYCGYGSELLRVELEKENINSILIVSKYFNNGVEATIAKDYLTKIVIDISDSDIDMNYMEIKKRFIKRGKLPENMGHAVLMIDNVMYDVTSEQFNLPETYSFDLFKKIWCEIYTAKIEISDQCEFGIRKINLRKKI